MAQPDRHPEALQRPQGFGGEGLRELLEHAVADIKGIHLSGFIAWITWLTVHLFYLIGFENRLLVFIRWAFSFATHGRGARLIAGGGDTAKQAPS